MTNDRVVENPSLVCEECGYADVKLVIFAEQPAATCTNCGTTYVNTRWDADRSITLDPKRELRFAIGGE